MQIQRIWRADTVIQKLSTSSAHPLIIVPNPSLLKKLGNKNSDKKGVIVCCFFFFFFFRNKNTHDDWKLHLKDFKINFKTNKSYLGVNICIIQRLSLYERVPWRFPLNGILPWCFLNAIYRPLTTCKKAGREKLPKYENLLLISQN